MKNRKKKDRDYAFQKLTMIRRKVKGVARQCKKHRQHSFSSLKVEGTILRCLMKMTKGQTLFSGSARYVKKEKETILL